MNIAPVPVVQGEASQAVTGAPAARPAPPRGASFADVLLDGLHSVDRKVAAADEMVRAFVTDESVPLHRVTLALEQARISMEVMMQVRARLVDGYQRIMDMRL